MEKSNERWLKSLVENYKKNKPDLNRKPKPILTEEQRKKIQESQK